MQFSNPLSIPKVGYVFFLLSIFTFSIDSFPFFPTSTVYRPISILFLLVPLFFYLLRGRLHKYSPWILLSIIFIFLHSIVATDVLFSQSNHLVKTSLTLFLLLVMLTTLLTLLNDGFRKPDIFFKAIGKVSFYALILTYLVVSVQFFMKVDVVPVSLSDQITTIFSYRSSQRIQGVSGEPSQMVRSLILLLILLFFFYKGRFKKLVLYLGFLLLLISGSTYGYITIILFLFFYVLFFESKLIFNYKFIFLALFFASLFSFFKESFFDSYTLNKVNAVTSVLMSLDMSIIQSILERDGSIFLRAMNPIIGFMTGSYSNFLGVGLDGYRYVYPDMISQFFPYATSFSTVAAAVNGENYITPKSLYSKVFSELGLIPFLIMIFYYIYLYLHILRLKNNSPILKLFFVYLVVVPINNDSIIYFNYFFVFVFLVLLVLNERRRYANK